MDTVDLLIKSSTEFYNDLKADENGRYRSWEHCYSHFIKARGSQEIDYDYLRSTQEIDRQSLGGRIDSKELTKKLTEILNNIPSLKEFYDNLPHQERPLYNKTISFIQDFEKSLDVIVRSMKEKAFYVWTIGNRNVNKREIPNDKILIDLMRNKGVDLIFNVEREILNKKQSKRNRSSKTMEKERILIFQRQY